MAITFVYEYEGRVLQFDSQEHEVCDCSCHRFSDRPNCLRRAEPCCYYCELCGQLIKRGVYDQHYKKHLTENGLKGWEAVTIAVAMAMFKQKQKRSLG